MNESISESKNLLPGYSSFVSQLVIITELTLHTKVPVHTIQTWNNFYFLIHAIDNRYDQEKNAGKRQEIAEKTVEFITRKDSSYPYPNPQEIDLATKLKQIIWQKEETEIFHFGKMMKQVFTTTEELRHVKTPAENARLTQLDGAVCAPLFCELLPGEINTKTGFNNFRYFVNHLAGAHKTLDSIKDFTEDHSNGQTEIFPGPIAYLYLAIGLLGELPPIIYHGSLAFIKSVRK